MKYSLWVTAIIFSVGFAAVAAPATNPPPRIYRDKIEPHWFADSTGATNRFWYRLPLAHDEKEFVLVDAAAGKREPAFDAARMAKALSDLTGETVDPKSRRLIRSHFRLTAKRSRSPAKVQSGS
jgi:hypothetical protein